MADDSSLTFCLAEAVAEGYTLERVATKFIQWRSHAYWTVHDNVFDLGATTNHSISRLEKSVESGNDNDLNHIRQYATEDENGNGSLMRILPLLFEIISKSDQEQFEIIWNNSAHPFGNELHDLSQSCRTYFIKGWKNTRHTIKLVVT